MLANRTSTPIKTTLQNSKLFVYISSKELKNQLIAGGIKPQDFRKNSSNVHLLSHTV